MKIDKVDFEIFYVWLAWKSEIGETVPCEFIAKITDTLCDRTNCFINVIKFLGCGTKDTPFTRILEELPLELMAEIKALHEKEVLVHIDSLTDDLVTYIRNPLAPEQKEKTSIFRRLFWRRPSS